MTTINATFEFERETKNAKRFQEVLTNGRERGIVGSIYVLKSDLKELGDPQKITVTIKAAK